MNEAPASFGPSIVVILDNDFTVAIAVWVAPLNRLSGRSTLPSFIFGLGSKLTIASVE